MRKGALPATAPSPYRRSVANAPSTSHSAGMPRRRPWIAVCEAALTLTPKKRNVEMLPGMRKQTRVRKGALPATAPSPHRRSVANALSACQPAGILPSPPLDRGCEGAHGLPDPHSTARPGRTHRATRRLRHCHGLHESAHPPLDIRALTLCILVNPLTARAAWTLTVQWKGKE